MANNSEVRLGAIRSWGRHVMRELASARTLVARGLEISDQGPSIADIRELAEPHMAILVHKRARACAESGADVRCDKRWAEELERHASYWAGSNHIQGAIATIAALLDTVVAEEQRRLAEASQMEAMPVTSRFDTSWAI